VQNRVSYDWFGMLMPEREYKTQEQHCHYDTLYTPVLAISDTFSLASWLSSGWSKTNSGTATYFSGGMQVSNLNSSSRTIGAKKTFTSGVGTHSVSFNIKTNTCGQVVFWPLPPTFNPRSITVNIRNSSNTVVATQSYTTTGGNFNFTYSTSSSGTYTIEFVMANAPAACYFNVDNVFISYNTSIVDTICNANSGGKYRYGFNGYEKDDEVKGSGNHITFGDYGYDVRTNRRWTVDKFTNKYPSYSPYVFAGDNPIFYQDKDGNDKIWYMNVILKDGTTITVATKRIVNNQCSLHYSQTAGVDGFGGDRFYTTDVKQTVTLDLRDGKTTVSPVEDDYSSQKSFGEGLLMKGSALFEGDNLEGKERGKQSGGWTLTSEFAEKIDGPKTDATKGSSGFVNADLIMAAFGAKGKSLELPDIKGQLGVAEALNTVKDLMSEIKELIGNYKVNGKKSFENIEMHCENECGANTTLKKVDSVQAADGHRHNFVPKKK
jgi:hypothetical protein